MSNWVNPAWLIGHSTRYSLWCHTPTTQHKCEESIYINVIYSSLLGNTWAIYESTHIQTSFQHQPSSIEPSIIDTAPLAPPLGMYSLWRHHQLNKSKQVHFTWLIPMTSSSRSPAYISSQVSITRRSQPPLPAVYPISWTSPKSLIYAPPTRHWGTPMKSPISWLSEKPHDIITQLNKSKQVQYMTNLTVDSALCLQKSA